MAKRKTSAATRERLRRMREKYGLGEYRNRKKAVRLKQTTRVRTMARRRSFAPRRSYFSRARKAARRHPKAVSELALLGYAVVGENLFDQLTSNFNMGVPPRILKIGAGYFLKKKSGLVGQLGTAMYTIELYKLGKDVASGGLNLGNLLGQPVAASTTQSSNGATF